MDGPAENLEGISVSGDADFNPQKTYSNVTSAFRLARKAKVRKHTGHADPTAKLIAYPQEQIQTKSENNPRSKPLKKRTQAQHNFERPNKGDEALGVTG
ncbi:unnamed protein product, partial [Iphiclides podalirius]